MDGLNESLTSLLSSDPCPPTYEEFFSSRGRALKLDEVLIKNMNASKVKKRVMAGGQPNPSVFPISTIDAHLQDGSTLHLDKKAVYQATTYGMAEGHPELRSWLEDFHKQEHQPAFWSRDDSPVTFDLVITSGITEGLRNAVDILLGPDDTILVETEIFFNTYSMLKLKCQTVTVDHDDQGMFVESVQDVLSNWHQRYPDRKFPKVLHAITAGNNPTGYTWTQERLVQIYGLCRKYNLLVLEDGAYYYLQYDVQLPSFQSIDVDGRVLRMDTFSKTLGGGFRLGWMTGPKPLVEKVGIATQFTSLHPNGLTQILVYNILEKWGQDGFRKQVKVIAEFYKRRAMLVNKAAEKHLKDLCTWSVPKAGMFLWLKVKDIEDSSEIVNTLFTKYHVAALSGSVFTPAADKSPGIRLSYSVVEEGEVDQAFKNIASAIKEYVTK